MRRVTRMAMLGSAGLLSLGLAACGGEASSTATDS